MDTKKKELKSAGKGNGHNKADPVIPEDKKKCGSVPQLVRKHLKLVLAGLVGNYTNHSVGKTCITNLLHAGVPPTVICQLSGHNNVNSINNYSVASVKQQQTMSAILQ